MGRLFAFILVTPLLISGCSHTPAAMAAPAGDDKAAFAAAATQYSIEVARARYVQRKCPTLMMSFDGLMRTLQSYPLLARPGGRMSEEVVDKQQVIDAVDRFEEENGLRGLGQEQLCAFGERQIAEGTRTGQLLERRKP